MHRSGREVPFPGTVLLFQPSESSVMPSSVESADKDQQGDESDGTKGHCFILCSSKQQSKRLYPVWVQCFLVLLVWPFLLQPYPPICRLFLLTAGSAFRLQVQSRQDGNEWNSSLQPTSSRVHCTKTKKNRRLLLNCTSRASPHLASLFFTERGGTGGLLKASEQR